MAAPVATTPTPLRIKARELFWRVAGAWRRHGVPVWLSRLEITRHEVALARLPATSEGLRIVQLTDLHMGPLFGPEAVERAVHLANAEQPDLILVTGDFIQAADETLAADRIRLLSGLRARLGVYGCLGNHDHWEGAELVWKLAEQAGVTMLNNDVAQPVEGLQLAAVDDLMSGAPDLDAVRAKVDDAHAVILMSHSPGILDALAGDPWLVLVGHTHGLQCRVPGVPTRRLMRCPIVAALVYALERWGAHEHGAPLSSVVSYRYPAGWFEHGQARMYVSRGVGFLQTAPLRIACPGEIAVFTLQGTGIAGLQTGSVCRS